MNFCQIIRRVPSFVTAPCKAGLIAMITLIVNLCGGAAHAGTFDDAMGRTTYVSMTGDVNGDGKNDVLMKAPSRLIMIPLDDDLTVPIMIPPPSPTFVLLSTATAQYTLLLNPSAEMLTSTAWMPSTQTITYAGPSGGFAASVTIKAANTEQASFVVSMAADTGILQITSTTAPVLDPLAVASTPSTPIPVVVDLPYLTNPDAGTLPGDVTVGHTGAAAYSLPIAVPPGTAGLAPKLSLEYSSLSGNGVAGYGWALSGTSSIRRCPKTIAQDGAPAPVMIAATDAFCLDGQRLFLASGTNGAVGSTYRTEIDNFARITAEIGYNGRIAFRVETKEGATKVYGATANSSVNPAGLAVNDALYWAVSRVTDRTGNAMQFDYQQDSVTGEHLLTEIKYGNKSTYYSGVKFSYTCRNGSSISNCVDSNATGGDAETLYLAGARVDLRKRLNTIETRTNTAPDGSGGQIAATYTLTYTMSPVSGRSQLQQVAACGGDGACLPPTVFEWSQGTSSNGFVAGPALSNGPAMNWPIPGGVIVDATPGVDYKGLVASTVTGDFLGLGKEQLMTADLNGFRLYTLNTAKTGFDTTDYSYAANPLLPRMMFGTPFYSAANVPSTQYIGVPLTGDFDGDGKIDFAMLDSLSELRERNPNNHKGDGKWKVCLSRPAAPLGFECKHFTLATEQYTAMVTNAGGRNLMAVDTDTDNRSDIVYWGWVGGANGSTASPGQRCKYSAEGASWNWTCAAYDGVFSAMYNAPLPSMGGSSTDATLWNASILGASASRTVVGDFRASGQSGIISHRDLSSVPRVISDVDLFVRVSNANNFGSDAPNGNAVTAGKGQFGWIRPGATPSTAYNVANVRDRYTLRQSPMVEYGGTTLGDMNGDGASDFLFTFEGHAEICYSNGRDGFDCRVMLDDTPNSWVKTERQWGISAPTIAPEPGNLFSVFSLLTIGNVHDKSFKDAIYVRSGYKISAPATVQLGNVYAVCKLRDGTRQCTDWTGPAIRPSVQPVRQDTWDGYSGGVVRMYWPDAGGRPGNFSGSGLTEILWYGSQADSAEGQGWRVYAPAVSGHNDRLIGVTNGTGARTVVQYKPMSDPAVYTPSAGGTSYPTLPVQDGARQLVSKVERERGGGNLAPTTYRYKGLSADAGGRGEQGFEQVSITDEKNIIQTITYAQNFPYIGVPLANSTVNASGLVLERSGNTLEHKVKLMLNGKASLFPYVQKAKQTERRDVDGSLLPLKIQTTSYDTWGNVLTSVSETQDQTVAGIAGYFKSTSTNTYDNLDTSAVYRIGELQTASSTAVAPSADNLNVQVTSTAAEKAFEYDGLGLLKQEKVAPGLSQYEVVTVYGRDSFGNISSITKTWLDPLALTNASVSTSAAYDGLGRFPTETKNALNQIAYPTYDARNGAQTGLKDENGLITSWTHNSLGRKLKEVRPDQTETRYYLKQCAAGCGVTGAKTVAMADSYLGTERLSLPTVIVSDSVGHVLRTQSWSLHGTVTVADTVYDTLGREERKYHPRLENTSPVVSQRLEYDVRNRVTTSVVLDDAGVEQATRIDYQGLLTVTTNPKKYIKSELRNGAGQLFRSVDAKQGTTTYGHDPFGRLVRVTDPLGNIVRVTYNLLGHKTQLVDPDLGTINYWVNPIGQTWKQDSPNLVSARKNVTFKFDPLGRMIERGYPTLLSTWIYDSLGAKTSCAATKSCGQLVQAYVGPANAKAYDRAHTYDSLGRPETIATMLDVAYTTRNAYDKFGRLSSVTHQRAGHTARTYGNRYNKFGYLSRIERAKGAVWVALDQDASGKITKALLGSGIQIDREYSNFTGRVRNATAVAGAEQRLLEAYDYDVVGNVSSRTQRWNNGAFFNELFGYDELNRLNMSTVSSVNLHEDFSYDAIGNILSKTGQGTYTYKPSGINSVRPHAVSSIGSLGAFTYDDNGNLRSGAGRTMEWTEFDMPSKITKGTATNDFLYGAELQRTKKTGSGPTVYYAGAVEANIINGAVTVKTYLPEGLGVEIDKPNTTVTELNYTHADRLGSVTAITDGKGILVESLAYDAWGKRRNPLGSSTADSIDGVVITKGFTGHEMLDEVDMVHMNGRVYDPATGRFASADPIIQDPEHSQSYNRYSYVWNNPTNLTDPTGFQTKCPGGGTSCADVKGQLAETSDSEKAKTAPVSGKETGPVAVVIVKGDKGDSANSGNFFQDVKFSGIATQIGRRVMADFADNNRGAFGGWGWLAEKADANFERPEETSADGVVAKVAATAMVLGINPRGGVAKAVKGESAFFRGAKAGEAPTFVPKAGDFKVDPKTGFVKDTHGVSVFDNPLSVRSKGLDPHQVDQGSVSDSLRIIQRGGDPKHFEIVPMPGANLTPQQFINACSSIVCVR